MALQIKDAAYGAKPGGRALGGEGKVSSEAISTSALMRAGVAQASPSPSVGRVNPRAFRKRLSAVRRWGLLACPAPKHSALEKWARWRSDAELNVAAVLPDHSPAGREAAAAALAARGGGVTGLQLTAPSFLAGKGARLNLGTFFGWAYGLRRLARLMVLGGAVLLIGALAVLLASEHVALTGGLESGAISAAEFAERHHRADLITRNADALLTRMADHPAAQRAAAAHQAALWGGGVFAAGLIFWALAVQARRRPARVLVLRPQGRRAQGAMRWLIAHELRPFGHVVGLSGRSVRRTRVAWTGPGLAAAGGQLSAVLLVLSTPARVIGRILDKARLVEALVASAQDYRSLARRLIDRGGQNFAAEMTTRETIVARPTDVWRGEVSRLLLGSSDVVIVDASALDAEDAADLSTNVDERVRGRLVFVCAHEAADEAAGRLRQSGLGLSHPLALYRRGGRLLDPRAFRETVLAAMRSRIGAA